MTDDRNDERGTTARNEETEGKRKDREGPEERRGDPADRHATRTRPIEVVDLQLLLEQIAASAGDPPEHGLAGVAARRRRRKRHRRGAVATAMTLAVVATVAAPFVVLDDHDDVTAGNAASEGGALRAELPDAVQLTCARTGIDVPVASIRPQRDGLHVEVVNELPGSTQVWVLAYDEDDPDEPCGTRGSSTSSGAGASWSSRCRPAAHRRLPHRRRARAAAPGRAGRRRRHLRHARARRATRTTGRR